VEQEPQRISVEASTWRHVPGSRIGHDKSCTSYSINVLACGTSFPAVMDARGSRLETRGLQTGGAGYEAERLVARRPGRDPDGGHAHCQLSRCRRGPLVSQLATDKAYRLEVIAHATCPSGTFDNSNRRAVAVQADFSKIANNQDLNSLTKVNSIFLTPSTDGTFQVLDGNACNTDGVLIQMPRTVSSTYEVWVRLVGQPNSAGPHGRFRAQGCSDSGEAPVGTTRRDNPHQHQRSGGPRDSRPGPRCARLRRALLSVA
jgi:hypothetical protein